MDTGVFSQSRAAIKERTLRTDRWWLQPAITFGVLFSFVFMQLSELSKINIISQNH